MELLHLVLLILILLDYVRQLCCTVRQLPFNFITRLHISPRGSSSPTLIRFEVAKIGLSVRAEIWRVPVGYLIRPRYRPGPRYELQDLTYKTRCK